MAPDDILIDVDEGYSHVLQWLKLLYDMEHIQTAMHAGVILAGQVRLGSAEGSLEIQHDLGEDSELPKISSTGVISLSVILAVDLILLLGLAIYSSLIAHMDFKL